MVCAPPKRSFQPSLGGAQLLYGLQPRGQKRQHQPDRHHTHQLLIFKGKRPHILNRVEQQEDYAEG